MGSTLGKVNPVLRVFEELLEEHLPVSAVRHVRYRRQRGLRQVPSRRSGTYSQVPVLRPQLDTATNVDNRAYCSGVNCPTRGNLPVYGAGHPFKDDVRSAGGSCESGCRCSCMQSGCLS